MSLREGLLCKEKETVLAVSTRAVEGVGSIAVLIHLSAW